MSGIIQVNPQKNRFRFFAFERTERLIQAGGNADLQSSAFDWTVAHKARASAALTTLRGPRVVIRRSRDGISEALWSARHCVA